mmetsp:Transcript_83668/g.259973  ORF Transcript_83668/g.259973 Transcript_83668/m.259973 type:complete len:200 (+) Transcript_83668:692-1291(+)
MSLSWLYRRTNWHTVSKSPMRSAWNPCSSQVRICCSCMSFFTKNSRWSSSPPEGRSLREVLFWAHSWVSSVRGSASHTAMAFMSFARSSFVVLPSPGEPRPACNFSKSSKGSWSMSSNVSMRSMAASKLPRRRTGKPCASSSDSSSKRWCKRCSIALRLLSAGKPRSRQSFWSSSIGNASQTSLSRRRSTRACMSIFGS